MTRLENLFNGLHEKIEFLNERLEKYRRDMEQAKIEYGKPFQYEAELKEKLDRQFELNNLLDVENNVPQEEPDKDRDESEETGNRKKKDSPHLVEGASGLVEMTRRQPYRH